MNSDAGVQDTIASLATPPGVSALAVVRLSGADAIQLVDRIFSGARKLVDLHGFEGAYGRIRDEAGVADEVVVWVYRAPHSFSGEDLVEISCHGGAIPARRVLDAVWGAGARPAQPGEFTRRAFLNGRIDLAQAEAVSDLIGARGRRAQELAMAHLEGGLSRRVRRLAARVRSVLARVTVYLDFDEDVPEPPDVAALLEGLESAAGEMERLRASHASSRRIQDGFTVALVGRPNVGKSSLMNALAGFDRAIVHETPGTTRDVVDLVVEWSGVPVRLIDTAGLRSEPDPVERVGIERTHREAGQADIVVWVVDGSAALTDEDRAVGERLNASRGILALNKTDLGARDSEWVNNYPLNSHHRVSAKTGEGLGSLETAITNFITTDTAGDQDGETVAVTRDRHALLLGDAIEALDRARAVLNHGRPAELAAADLNRALGFLGEITGDEAGPDLLDHIFSEFCIGK